MHNGGIHIVRIISGQAKGHKLKTVKGDTTRPTSDRVKESLFNIIAPHVADAEVLDVYAGTGNLGIEALSRGARFAVFIDRSAECFSIIKENLQHTKLFDKAEVFSSDVFTALDKLGSQGKKFDIIFLDPPYHKNLIEVTLNCIIKNDIIKREGVVIAERDVDDRIPENVGYMKLVRNQKYGNTIVSFYQYCE